MSKKKPGNDAAFRETRWIDPIHIQAEYNEPEVKKAKHARNAKNVKMRENKQEHQHTFRHEQINRTTLPKNVIK